MDTKNFRNAKEPLGEILVRRGSITAAQLDEALARQAKNHQLIGEILVGMGLLEDTDIIAALITQFGVPYAAVNKYNILPEVLKLVPEAMVRKLSILPIDLTGGVLSVVMLDPLQKDIIRQIEKLTGAKVAPFITSRTELEQAISRHFGLGSKQKI